MTAEYPHHMEDEPRLHPSHIEISKGNLLFNWQSIQKIVGRDVTIIPMLKAYAYGHGLPEVGRILQDAGAKFAGVFNANEARELRRMGVDTPILITGYIYTPDIRPTLALGNISLTISDPNHVAPIEQVARQSGEVANVHVFIDTGMHREGIDPEDLERVIGHIHGSGGAVQLEGLMTHFADPTNPDLEFTYRQLALFNKCLDRIEAMKIPLPPYIHAAEGAALMRLPQTHQGDPFGRMTAVRPGNIVYGLKPGGKDFPYMTFQARQAMTAIKTRLMSTSSVAAGATIGYAGSATTSESMRTGDIMWGHADDLRPRGVSGGSVLIDGKFCPIVGRSTMNQTIVQLPSEGSFDPGDEVVIMGIQGGNEITLDDLTNSLQITSFVRYAVKLDPTIPREVVP